LTARFCATSDDAPREGGAYVLLIETSAPVALRMAGRRQDKLTPGRYLYCGSAKGPGGLRARLTRHMRRKKAVRWHVDQLTTRGAVRGAWIFPAGDECALVAQLAHLPAPILGFGSSDCRRCRSHLLHWEDGAVLPFAT
jgi:Uri superfamily endonuclease